MKKESNKEIFVCLDTETTGLDVEKDRIIEIAAVKFTLEKNLSSISSLIDPQMSIPQESIEIHHITDSMVQGMPTIKETLPSVLQFIQGHIIVGHQILFDLQMMEKAAQEESLPFHPTQIKYIDTLRMARLYGKSPNNSLEGLRKHFNISDEGAHRALSDVSVNIDVFKQLIKPYRSVKDLMDRLERPILLKKMPLGKHKGRIFSEIPIDYLRWTSRMDFDRDLLFSIRHEIKRRSTTSTFETEANPFSSL